MVLDRLMPLKIMRLISSLSLWLCHRPMFYRMDQPFRLLLKLEWLLLSTAVFMEVLLPFQPSWFVFGRVVAIALFGFLGLCLPPNWLGAKLLEAKLLGAKLLYTALEFGLILFAALQDSLSSRSIFLLCLVLVMRSCLLFQYVGQIAILALSLLTYGALLLSKPIAIGKVAIWDWRFSNILLFSLTLIFAVLLINALLSERHSRKQLEIAHQELAATHQQLRQYALRIEDQATLQERNRIAREIHDGLGHTLAAQTIQINNTLLFWQSNPEQAITSLKQAKQLGAEAFLEVRKSVSMLRSHPLQGQPLEVALKKLLTDFQATTGIEVISHFQILSALPPEVNTTLFRILQESLTNISKHAKATTVSVNVQQAERIHLTIADNGQGFHPTQNTTGFGLQGMRERATALGGEWALQSQPGRGCAIAVALPFAHPAP